MRRAMILLAASATALMAAETPVPERRAAGENSHSSDKSPYTLWNPTPRSLLRELDTDRPDKTESPITVDAGHVQLEADVVNYSYDRYNSARDHTRVETLAIAPFNLKVGLCNSADFQLVVPPYTAVRTRDHRAGHTRYDRGFGDILTRVKVNLWGNDGGDTALAVMPFVKWPTGSGHIGNDSVEGGIIVPLSVSLPHEWTMVTMAEVDFTCDEDGSGHHADVINSVTFGHEIVGDLSGYVEFYSNLSTERHGVPWIATADLGLTYALKPDIQLDAGANIGITRAADDINPFMGVTFRF